MTELTPWLFLIAGLLLITQSALTLIGMRLPQVTWLTAGYFIAQTLLTLAQALLVGCTGILRDWQVTSNYDPWFLATAAAAGILWLIGMLLLHRLAKS